MSILRKGVYYQVFKADFKSLVVGRPIRAMSKMVVTTLLLVDTSVKVNGKYCFDVLFSQQMLPAIKSVAGDTFIIIIIIIIIQEKINVAFSPK